MACDSRRAVRNQPTVTCPLFVFAFSLPCAKNRTDLRRIRPHLRVLQKADHWPYGCAPVLMISVLSPSATPG